MAWCSVKKAQGTSVRRFYDLAGPGAEIPFRVPYTNFDVPMYYKLRYQVPSKTTDLLTAH